MLKLSVLSCLLVSAVSFAQGRGVVDPVIYKRTVVVGSSSLKVQSVVGSRFDYKDVKDANLEINRTDRILSLTVFYPSGPSTIKISLAQSSPTKDACGLVTYEGAKNMEGGRPGSKIILTVQDFSKFVCPTKKAFGYNEETAVTLEYLGVTPMHSTYSQKVTFNGSRLVDTERIEASIVKPTPPVVEEAKLKIVSLDKGFEATSFLQRFKYVSSALLQINETTNTISLRLNFPPPPPCLPKHFCPQYERSPIVVKLPLVAPKTRPICGLRTISGEEDKRPVDGDKVTIDVTDWSHFTCPTTKPIALDEMTTVTLQYSGDSRIGGPFKATMSLRGTKLEKAYPILPR